MSEAGISAMNTFEQLIEPIIQPQLQLRGHTSRQDNSKIIDLALIHSGLFEGALVRFPKKMMFCVALAAMTCQLFADETPPNSLGFKQSQAAKEFIRELKFGDQASKLHFDSNGLLISKNWPNLTFEYHYDSTKKLQYATSSNGSTYSLERDQFNRVQRIFGANNTQLFASYTDGESTIPSKISVTASGLGHDLSRAIASIKGNQQDSGLRPSESAALVLLDLYESSAFIKGGNKTIQPLIFSCSSAGQIGLGLKAPGNTVQPMTGFCPGNPSIEICKQSCDRYYDRLMASCDRITDNRARAVCRSEASGEYAQCLLECK